jgi:hypothetical protein
MEKDYIGLLKKEAFLKAKNEGFIFRVMKEDDISFFGTTDFKLNRLNFEIKKDKIVDCYIG